MPGEEIIIATAIAGGGYIGNKLFGTALASMGDDINKLYVKGRDKLVEVATKKIDNPDDGQKVNLRAARDVMWNGAITEDEVCAEYFGGMLAAARSEDGKDDGVVHYVDTVKAMSARQLELHYIIYKSWQTMLIAGNKSLNIAQSEELYRESIFFSGMELLARNIPYDRDLTVLHRLGLISGYKYNNHYLGTQPVPYVSVNPTTFGVMLFAIAHNKINTWHNFCTETYESQVGISPVKHFAISLDALSKSVDLPLV